MRIFFAAVLLAVSCISASSDEFKTFQDDLGFRRIVFVSQPSSERSRVSLIIHSGEYALEGSAGQAHYLEHLVYMHANGGGLPNSSAQGRHSNATTSGTYTSYWFEDSSEKVGEMLAKASLVFDPPNIDAKYAEAEKQIVVHEWDLRLGKNPRAEHLQQALTELYSNNSFGRSVLGDRSTIQSFSIEDALKIHASHYVRCNSSLLVSGAIDDTEVYELIKDYFPREESDRTKCNGSTNFEQHTELSRHFDKTVELNELSIGQVTFVKDVQLDQKIPYIQLVALTEFANHILDSTLDGSIVRPLRFDEFIASETSVSVELLDHHNARLFVSARPDFGVDTAQLRDAIKEQILRLEIEGIPDATFTRIKSKLLDRKRTAPDTEQAHLSRAHFWVFRDHDPKTRSQYIEALKTVLQQDFDNFISKLFGNQGFSILLEFYPS